MVSWARVKNIIILEFRYTPLLEKVIRKVDHYLGLTDKKLSI
jgi:hypothetical protein